MPVLSSPPPLPVRRLGMIARWKPVHVGHAVVLEALCESAEQVIIGIGSSNKYDLDNPFTAAETAEMIRLVLAGRDNFSLCEVPDLGDGPRWAAMVTADLGPLDLYCTANAWVRDLLAPTWNVLHPVHLVPPRRRVPLDGTMVRRAMAEGEAWRGMVPEEIEAHLDARGLVDRFRREFGRATLARAAPSTPS